MTVITVSRQLGSLGCEIAQTAAQELGLRLMWRELIHAAAHKAGSPEIALEVVDEFGLLGINSNSKERRVYRKALQEVLLEQAALGDVILLGRAGQVVLQNFPKTLHVRVIAPLETRIERVAQTQKISAEAAQTQINASDSSRERFLHRFFNARITDPLLYDLVINTGRMSVAQSTSLIACAVQKL